jgi:hypothetical protein
MCRLSGSCRNSVKLRPRTVARGWDLESNDGSTNSPLSLILTYEAWPPRQ